MSLKDPCPYLYTRPQLGLGENGEMAYGDKTFHYGDNNATWRRFARRHGVVLGSSRVDDLRRTKEEMKMMSDGTWPSQENGITPLLDQIREFTQARMNDTAGAEHGPGMCEEAEGIQQQTLEPRETGARGGAPTHTNCNRGASTDRMGEEEDQRRTSLFCRQQHEVYYMS